jgi:FMN phosphatase YigB (HAD superfamily)
MIKALIFDADGPLYHRGSEVKSQKVALLREFGYEGDFQDFEAAYDKEKFKGYVQAETAQEMFANILASLGLKSSAIQAATFTEEFNAIQRLITASPEAKVTLRLLRQSGYKICVLTDSFYPADEKWAWFQELGMDDYIDDIVSSYDIKALKDTKEAYDVCLNLLKEDAGRTLFVGHQQYEMDGAKKAGITSVALLPIAIPKDIHADYVLRSLSELESLLKRL